MPPNPPSNSRLPRLAVWSGYGTACVTIQMKATEQYLPVVLFIMLYKVVLTFESGMKS